MILNHQEKLYKNELPAKNSQNPDAYFTDLENID